MMIFYDDSQRSSDDPKSEHLPWCSGLADLMTRWRRADAGQVSRASFVALMYTLAFHTNFFLSLVMTSISSRFALTFVIADLFFLTEEAVASSMRLHMATLMSLLPITMMWPCVVVHLPSTIGVTHHPSPYNITTPHWKAHRPLENPNLGSLTIPHPHCYIITSVINHQPTTTQHNLHRLPAKMPAPDLCCINPPTRSLSPTEPARPSPFSLDGIFAVAALPNDHPHSLKVPVPDRRPPKHLIRSPSFANKLKGQLRRRATVKSLKAEVCGFDGDARVLMNEEICAPMVRVREV